MKKKILLNGETLEFNLEKSAQTTVALGDVSLSGEVLSRRDSFDIIRVGARNIRVKRVGDYISIDGVNYKVESAQGALKKGANEDHNMSSPMPGKILKVIVSEGDDVEVGQGLLVMEAMKMEHTIKAASAGRIVKIFYKEGDLVDGGVDLIELDDLKEEA